MVDLIFWGSIALGLAVAKAIMDGHGGKIHEE